MTQPFVIEPLSKDHDRTGFSCGHEKVDAYFRLTVSQDVKRKYATCFVARKVTTGRVAGFYTLSASSVLLKDVPDALAKKLPRYPTVPAVLIGWMGRDEAFRGTGVGEALLFDAIRTVATAPIGSHAIFADAIDGKAATFYADYGFIPLLEQPMRLFLPVATGRILLSE